MKQQILVPFDKLLLISCRTGILWYIMILTKLGQVSKILEYAKSNRNTPQEEKIQ